MALRKNPERKNLESGKRNNPESENLECANPEWEKIQNSRKSRIGENLESPEKCP